MLTLQLICFCLLTAVWADYVDLPHGRLQGHRLLSRKGREIFSFQGIPYAKPPVGELRFQPPQPPEPWTGVLDATKEGPDCMQRPLPPRPKSPEVVGDEDCLYLNVYTPLLPADGEVAELLPVMFWIHGGGWVAGSGSSDLYGPQYLLDKEIVLVTINYRLGAFGFFSTGNEVCPGNNGFKDQVAALRWVRDNIAAFGGNPDNVTIFGHGAGGASVHYLMLSAAGKGLFHRGISQSGTATSLWALPSPGTSEISGLRLAYYLDCPTEPSSLMISCIREVDAEEIILSISELTVQYADGGPDTPDIRFGPVVEKAVGEGDEMFLSKTAMGTVLASYNKHRIVPWMVGFTSGDGAIIIEEMHHYDTIFQNWKKLQLDLQDLEDSFRSRDNETRRGQAEIRQWIKAFLFDYEPLDKDSRKVLIEMYTDLYFIDGADAAVRIHYNTLPTTYSYYYYFDYRGKNSYSTVFGRPTENYGAYHMDELMYLFPQDHIFSNSRKTVEDDEMIDIMTTIWTNFARTGSPTSEVCNLVKWKPVSPPDSKWQLGSFSSPEVVEYGHIDRTGLHVENKPLKGDFRVWDFIADESEQRILRKRKDSEEIYIKM
ncbi:carboxylic ester hydrolase-like isoform X2 [Periplaneta americana]|uniref:carboxylic ester hydrolase-like isoform X2 n=1 Tax=Periplaneta americana TaxID=6978 RepID=UPI0037E739A0